MSRSKYSGVVLDDLFGRGHNEVRDLAVDWRLGWQSLDWGRRLMALGGLRELNPLDISASLRPGVDREHETRVTFPAAFGRVALSQATSVEAFYQLGFEPTALPGCGTFYSVVDFMAEGCDKAMFGGLSDRTAVATGSLRAAHRDAGSGGLGAGRHRAEAHGRDLGNRVRALCHAVPLAHARFTAGPSRDARPVRCSFPAIRAASIRRISPSTRKTSACSARRSRKRFRAAWCSASSPTVPTSRCSTTRWT